MEIAVDFDGTCVTHEYPNIGKDIGAQKVLNKLVEKGHKLILYTMRSNKELTHAVNWFNDNGIPLYGINTNPTQKEWTTSPKCYAQLFIDDASLGCPLIYPSDNHDHLVKYKNERPYVNWEAVEIWLENKDIL